MKKKWWVIPVTLIGALLAECIVFGLITFAEFLIFEGIWDGNSLTDTLVIVIKIIVYLVLSYFFYYIILPYIFIETGLDYKIISVILFILYTFISVIECWYILECYYWDILDYSAYYSSTDNMLIPFVFKWILMVVNIVLIFAVNFIRPIFFTVSSYKSVKEKTIYE